MFAVSKDHVNITGSLPWAFDKQINGESLNYHGRKRMYN